LDNKGLDTREITEISTGHDNDARKSRLGKTRFKRGDTGVVAFAIGDKAQVINDAPLKTPYKNILTAHPMTASLSREQNLIMDEE